MSKSVSSLQQRNPSGGEAMTSSISGDSFGALAPSRRDVVKGAATAIAATVAPIGRLLAAEGSSTVSGTV
jgi:hypothetical protein